METVKIQLEDERWVDVVLIERYGFWSVVSDANEYPNDPRYWVTHHESGRSAMWGGVTGFHGVTEAHEWAQALHAIPGDDPTKPEFQEQVYPAWRKFNAGKTVRVGMVTITYGDV
jgi:hypothetical protein